MTYAGFWRRFGVGLLDLAIIFPFGLLTIWVYSHSQLAPSIWLLPLISFGVWFNVYLVRRYGGTPGKVLLGLRIVRVDGTPVGYKEAFLRHLPLLLSGALIGLALVFASWKLTDAEHMGLAFKLRQMRMEQLAPSWYEKVLAFEQIWMLGEFLVMMTNAKRRALHDYIAGTVVILNNSAQQALATDAQELRS
jgi:uncharacterized RDD family membrane protein YckC